MDINRYKSQLTKLFKENNVVCAYLFGSYAKKDIGPLSDIDIAVLLTKDTEKRVFFVKLLKLNNEIVRIFHQNNVDIVILNEALPSLKFHIINEGIIIFDSNPKFRYDFEARSLIDYIDTRPLRDEYNKYLFKNVKEGGFL